MLYRQVVFMNSYIFWCIQWHINLFYFSFSLISLIIYDFGRFSPPYTEHRNTEMYILIHSVVTLVFRLSVSVNTSIFVPITSITNCISVPLPNQLIHLYQWQLLVFLAGSTITEHHIVTANRGTMMNGDDAKQSPQYPLSFSKLPLRPADTYWAPLQCLALGPPHASLTVGLDWPDTSRRCQAVSLSFATAAHLPLRWLLDRAKRGWAGGRCLFQTGQESKCGSAVSWKNQQKNHIEKSCLHTHRHTHTAYGWLQARVIRHTNVHM